MSTRNYSHITKFDIDNGIKYHVSQADKSNLASLSTTLADLNYNMIPTSVLPSGVVYSNQTVMIDMFSGTSFFSCEWRVDVMDSTGSIVVKNSIFAVWSYRDNTIAFDERKISIGSTTGLSFLPTLVAGVVKLSIVNNSATTWSVSGRRINS